MMAAPRSSPSVNAFTAGARPAKAAAQASMNNPALCFKTSF